MTATLSAQNAPEFLVLPTLSKVPQAPDGSPLSGGTIEVALVPITGDAGREQLTALAFTSVPLLVEAMGEEQPWVIVPAGEMGKALSGSGAVAVLVDPRLADADGNGDPTRG
ncbi:MULTISPECIES: SAV_915 family protein [unclassified Streptomyces]|uniref:SAV_915 family protein n=1 Tax=unclassified Streptomyces TaxID=2593676 RepID=UPI0036F15CF9